jgi:hypothetical protein
MRLRTLDEIRHQGEVLLRVHGRDPPAKVWRAAKQGKEFIHRQALITILARVQQLHTDVGDRPAARHRRVAHQPASAPPGSGSSPLGLASPPLA